MTTQLFRGEHAASYDLRMPRLVPGYGLIPELTLPMLRTQLGEKATILVAGAGTGAEIIPLAKAEPGWSFIAIEPSPDMVALLDIKLDELSLKDRVSLHNHPMEVFDSEQKADAAIANLVSHFIQGDTAKTRFFRALFQVLKPASPLLHLEYVPGSEPVSPEYNEWARQAGHSEADVQQMSVRIANGWDAPSQDRLSTAVRAGGFKTSIEFFRALDYRGFLSR
ncbi:class I SAM-dependent methyltransferase [Labrenzia sp. CE80]|uniref:class I SAM-dependent methyltransferase n=1 Tax=Labrenzia sp. CE80 TaxID=1788986 RepID=UPI00129C0E06|nr:class I SAM-dependent methyltransferase [Labrenzia sp. CE80]